MIYLELFFIFFYSFFLKMSMSINVPIIHALNPFPLNLHNQPNENEVQ